MTMVACPHCEKLFELDSSTAPPFCSPRCKLIDLGRWVSEEYGMPVERQMDSEEFPEDY